MLLMFVAGGKSFLVNESVIICLLYFALINESRLLKLVYVRLVWANTTPFDFVIISKSTIP